ncbi:magnesium transporter CorA family protein [Dellaglioa carnosa]|uniref:magnesium transporter CorA family protein n=1 Tax=Dellaglioa carnosa TaxID=2995136 RepID=UPI0022A8B362|nr:magnesium transporter CorA family protein [Dellaglioa carnosa]MCZ2492390.1 magnesium transporter CorA family protein [Dellaglioa carnosa]
MIEYYASTESGKIEKKTEYGDLCWINVTGPSADEVDELVAKYAIPRDYITAVLDDQENSRTEGLSQNTVPDLVLMQYPHRIRNSLGYLEYQTFPFSIILAGDAIITVSNSTPDFINDFISDSPVHKIKTTTPDQFTLKLLWYLSQNFVFALNTIIQETENLEKSLAKATKNEQYYQMMSMQKSLVYFDAALKKNNPVLQSMADSNEHFKQKKIDDLLTDVLIENQQAETMTMIQTKILDNYGEMVSSVISNNLNIIMKVLTSMTIILTIPTIIGGMYGMNVPLPGVNMPFSFWWLQLLTLIICLLTAYYLKKNDYF